MTSFGGGAETVSRTQIRGLQSLSNSRYTISAYGANSKNRTRKVRLEVWSFTIKLYLQFLAKNNKLLRANYKALQYVQWIRTISLIFLLGLYLTSGFGFAYTYFTDKYIRLLFDTLQTLSYRIGTTVIPYLPKELPLRNNLFGVNEGNWTLISTLARSRSTIELHLQIHYYPFIAAQ